MKMHRYNRIRGSRSADFEEPNWKERDHSVDPGSINDSEDQIQIQRIRHGSLQKEKFVREAAAVEVMDPSGQTGFILGRALSLKETIKDKKLSKKVSSSKVDSNNGNDGNNRNNGNNNSLQGAVKRVFSMRKSAPDQERQHPHSDFLSADAGFKRSESLRYRRISSPPPADMGEDGSVFNKKKKKSVLKTCKRLLGMQRN